MDQRLKDKLIKREEEGTMRSLSLWDNLVDFYSNDYLGLTKLQIESKSSGGSTGSRLISGNSKEAILCEKGLADFFQEEAALVYNSGYDANVGFFSCIPQKGDTILYDEKIHASIRDGIRLSFATSYSFRHNDLNDLQSKLTKSLGAIYVVVESLYSMDGDKAPLDEIHLFCKEKGVYLIVDEAHACGVFGKAGRGLTDYLSDKSALFARIVTFGKAYGFHGACVLGSTDLIQYLINFSRSFIYTTALPPENYSQILARVTNPEIISKQIILQENISQFVGQFPEKTFVSEISSPIQVLRIGEIEKTKKMAEQISSKEFAVKAIYSPTVPKGEESIRFCIHSFNSKSEILNLAETMKTV
jgi:8-amino-7-oxononanoate synthase